eukprot:gene33960-43870_t
MDQDNNWSSRVKVKAASRAVRSASASGDDAAFMVAWRYLVPGPARYPCK